MGSALQLPDDIREMLGGHGVGGQSEQQGFCPATGGKEVLYGSRGVGVTGGIHPLQVAEDAIAVLPAKELICKPKGLALLGLGEGVQRRQFHDGYLPYPFL